MHTLVGVCKSSHTTHNAEHVVVSGKEGKGTSGGIRENSSIRRSRGVVRRACSVVR